MVQPCLLGNPCWGASSGVDGVSNTELPMWAASEGTQRSEVRHMHQFIPPKHLQQSPSESCFCSWHLPLWLAQESLRRQGLEKEVSGTGEGQLSYP